VGDTAAALVDGLAAVAGLTLHSGDLHAEADAAAARIDALVADSAEHRNLVRQLEVQVDAVETPPAPEMTLPTGDELAVELERFLREQSD